MPYLYAIVAYAIIGGIMGWKHGGGAIFMALFLVAVIWAWRAIMKGDEE
jgi:hypothetical protein